MNAFVPGIRGQLRSQVGWRRGRGDRVERIDMFVRKKRGAARGSKKAKGRKPAGRMPRPRLPEGLQQRHLDIIGLLLIASGVYLTFVLFLGWEGGKVGYGIETALQYLFGEVGARIATVLTLIVGGVLVTGTSISSILRGLGRGARHLLLGGRDAAQTAIQQRDARREQKTLSGLETADGATDVMSTYPDEEAFAPTVALGGAADEDWDADGATAGPGREAEEPAVDGEALHSTDEDHDPTPSEDAEGPDAAAQGPSNDAPPTAELPALTPQGNKRGVTTSEQIDYRPPPAKALERGKADSGPDPRDHEVIGRKLVETLGHFGVEAKIVGIVSGPHVSRFELRLAPGTKVKKVTELGNDLAYALASTDIRILAPIPGKQAVGVEVPNTRRRIVRLGDIYSGRPAKTSPLVAWLGKGIDGNAVWTDIAKMPHVLVAGTTGSGKSGCVNAILSSILMQASPNEVRLVLVDPKQVELNHYEHVPHLLTPVVTSPRLAANVLANLIGEMESRYGIMGQARCRNLDELNRARAKAGEPPLPHILCVIDELADLMMVSPAEVEDSIIRLAQKSRATGIHLVLATQRPSTDIITGTIKVNIPARIAFAVSSQTDSRVILDQGGAEALLGQGDMLFRGAGTSKLQRIQGAFITEEEIARITKHWAKQGEPEFEEELLETRVVEEEGVENGEFDPDSDDLLDDAIRLVVETETASVSMIQRRLRVGYTRAGRLIDMLERRGVISGYEGSKPRQVLISPADLERVTGASAPEPVPAEALDTEL
jgi:DNA segregation ATPase FtsK/SpoIIIE, S-DNA-T family